MHTFSPLSAFLNSIFKYFPAAAYQVQDVWTALCEQAIISLERAYNVPGEWVGWWLTQGLDQHILEQHFWNLAAKTSRIDSTLCRSSDLITIIVVYPLYGNISCYSNAHHGLSYYRASRCVRIWLLMAIDNLNVTLRTDA